MTSSPPFGIEVEPVAIYVANQANVEQGVYLFAYTIAIRNLGHIGVRLLTRHWVITDQADNVQEVRGNGVVGEQPYIAVGDKYQYSSSAAIKTPLGQMRGHYGMVTDNGDEFEVEIPLFKLIARHALN